MKAFGFADGGYFVVRFDAGASYLLRVGDLNSDQSYAYAQRGNDPTVLQVPFRQLYPILLLIIDPTTISTPAATSGP